MICKSIGAIIITGGNTISHIENRIGSQSRYRLPPHSRLCQLPGGAGARETGAVITYLGQTRQGKGTGLGGKPNVESGWLRAGLGKTPIDKGIVYAKIGCHKIIRKGRSVITAQTATVTTEPPRESREFTKRIGFTTFEVTVYPSNTSKETINDKILRLIRNDTEAAGK